MTIAASLGRRKAFCRAELCLGSWLLGAAVVAFGAGALAAGRDAPIRSEIRLQWPFVVTQLPAGSDLEKHPPDSGGMLRGPYGEGARLVLVSPDGSARVLTPGFRSACDPDVSFDATRILFAGKRSAGDAWNIYEMAGDGSGVQQVTRDLGDCRSPGYQSSLYTLMPVGVPNEPRYHITFVAGDGTMNEYGTGEATHLYSCKLDGSAVRRLTFNLSSEMDPFLMDDGRLVFAGWQRARLDHGLLGRVALFGVDLDGADYALYAGYQGRRIKQMPCATERLVVFVEADRARWDGAGCLCSVEIRRPLHSYRPITDEADGLFHSPSPLPDGRILVSRRPRDGSGTHAVYRLDPASGKTELVFDDPRYHEIQAKLIRPRDEPDGRSTAVSEEKDKSAFFGKFYCLDVYTSDLGPAWMPPRSIQRLRVLEGVPLKSGEWRVESGEWAMGGAAGKSDGGEPVKSASSSHNGHPHSPLTTLHSPLATLHRVPPLAQRRILGDIPLEKDGSFNVQVPANTPVELQVLDADGMALRSCGWIWVKDYARQGCIGCHEDGELVPEDSFVDAVRRPSVSLTLPPERRRCVDFRRDVMPIIARKCAPCHGKGDKPIYLDADLGPAPRPGGNAPFNRTYRQLLAPADRGDEQSALGKYVHPGCARTSPLIWNVFGRNTSRPWDELQAKGPIKPMPPAGSPPLSQDEKRTLVEWIDLGALWDGIPDRDEPAGRGNKIVGEN